MRGRVRWLTSVTAAMLVSGAVVVAITQVRAHGGNPNLIHSCVNATTGAIRIVGPADTCNAGGPQGRETALDWSPQGAAVTSVTSAGSGVGSPTVATVVKSLAVRGVADVTTDFFDVRPCKSLTIGATGIVSGGVNVYGSLDGIIDYVYLGSIRNGTPGKVGGQGMITVAPHVPKIRFVLETPGTYTVTLYCEP